MAGASVVLDPGDVVEIGPVRRQTAVVAGAGRCSHVDQPLQSAGDESLLRVDADDRVVDGVGEHPGPASGVLDHPAGHIGVDRAHPGELRGLIRGASGGVGRHHHEDGCVHGLAARDPEVAEAFHRVGRIGRRGGVDGGAVQDQVDDDVGHQLAERSALARPAVGLDRRLPHHVVGRGDIGRVGVDGQARLPVHPRSGGEVAAATGTAVPSGRRRRIEAVSQCGELADQDARLLLLHELRRREVEGEQQVAVKAAGLVGGDRGGRLGAVARQEHLPRRGQVIAERPAVRELPLHRLPRHAQHRGLMQ